MQLNINKIVINVAVILALSALFTFFSVYDSDKLPFAERFLFWGSTIGAGIAISALAGPWVRARLLPKHSVGLQLVTTGAIVSFAIPPILLWFDTGFEQAWPVTNWVRQYILTYVIVILVLSGDYVVRKAFAPTKTPVVEADKAGECVQKFLRRLPVKYYSAQLYAISSEDHYLRVHTDRGNELILMRLADAMQELEACDGMQTHRSWWVARDGITEMKSKSGKQSLLLKCGTEVPISRARAKGVRENFLSTES